VAVGIRFAPGGVMHIRTVLLVSTGSVEIREWQLKQGDGSDGSTSMST
jgi:hypothetical protein